MIQTEPADLIDGEGYRKQHLSFIRRKEEKI